MKINLKKLISANAERIPFEGVADLSAEQMNGEYPFQHPVCFFGEITNRNNVLLLSGTTQTTYEVRCARCLKPLSLPLSVETEMVLAQDDGEHEETEDVFLIEGDEVDPADILIPALFLDIEMVYLCKEDCKGLCPHCGADRNDTHCDCNEAQIDDRLAVLKTLLDSEQDH